MQSKVPIRTSGTQSSSVTQVVPGVFVHVYADKEQLLDAACNALRRRLFADCQGLEQAGHDKPKAGDHIKHKYVRLALAGGSTPRGLYQRIAAAESNKEQDESPIDWSCVEFFWGDERCVEATHKASNYRMAKESLLDHIPIDPDRVHRIRGEMPATEAAAAYSIEVSDEALHLIILGIGSDAHTASLFPQTRLGGEKNGDLLPAAIATKSPLPPHDRVSLSLASLNRARWILFLVSGQDKAAALSNVFDHIEKGHNAKMAANAPPAARVQATNGETHWFVDQDAASGLASYSSQTTPDDNHRR